MSHNNVTLIKNVLSFTELRVLVHVNTRLKTSMLLVI